MKHDQASSTARFVSNGIYWVSQHPKLSVEVPEPLSRSTAELTRCLLEGGSLRPRGLARRLLLWKAGLMQACAIPGIYLHQVLRKRLIESLAEEAIAQGTRQVVVLGAGFDTVSLRLAERHPECRVLEVDHPATQRAKRSILEHTTLPTEGCRFLPADLGREELHSVLEACPDHDPDRPTLFIIEGVTMYLQEPAIRKILEEVARHPRGSALLFTYMEEFKPGCFEFQNARRVASWWLALRHERFTWGIHPDRLPEFLSESNFELRYHRTVEELRNELLTPPNRGACLAIGEHTALVSAKV